MGLIDELELEVDEAGQVRRRGALIPLVDVPSGSVCETIAYGWAEGDAFRFGATVTELRWSVLEPAVLELDDGTRLELPPAPGDPCRVKLRVEYLPVRSEP